ncbi:nitrogen regulatory IIA protein [Sphingobacterium humi]|uniref:Nitrogen regulatory IIA protein n=1 Tax=Sphingobacterium humi TaxID=1796905 RepID=A0A6N8L308_9SPHI|nr:nitrogen regulatory IIA protein [Sphingobacterium humi]MVZ63726.1 nitrogen regulatory IIA protein [Sphingobacterium humi]
MKKLRIEISNWFDKLDRKWRAMPVKEQQRKTLLLFAGYALLSFIVLLEVCYDVAHSDNTMTIEHIENPIRQNNSSVSTQDSITILKDKNHESCMSCP